MAIDEIATKNYELVISIAQVNPAVKLLTRFREQPTGDEEEERGTRE